MVEITAKKTSLVPAAAAANAPMPDFRLRTIFSTTTMASSTTIPVANTSARRLIVFTENPVIQIAASVPIRATGIVTAGINVALEERKNRKITATTIPVAMRIDLTTSLIDPSMKMPSFDVTNSCTFSGNWSRNSSTAIVTSREISSVLPTDCRVISRPMAVSPFTRVKTLVSSGIN